MDTFIIATIAAGYIVQWGAALVVVLKHAQDKTKSPPDQLMR